MPSDTHTFAIDIFTRQRDEGVLCTANLALMDVWGSARVRPSFALKWEQCTYFFIDAFEFLT
eukprot:m.769139 g.769139  ORF g.769139 m.769139 type:complete len:62 (-) comp23235_c0_seq5:4563-4748(-)